jgi:flagellar L-ring protein precursor FlgH
MRTRINFVLGLTLVISSGAQGLGAHKAKAVQHETLAEYVARVEQQVPAADFATSGSLWSDSGPLASLTSDFKAANVGDLITIMVAQDVTATNSGTVGTNRSFGASSGVDSLAGKLKTAGVQQLFSPHSTSTLSGKSQAQTASSLRTSLTGRVVAVLPSGSLVIEAERQVTMNNEHQTVLLRGLVRRADITTGNMVSSNSIGDLELELKGKGVLSDGTRPPNLVVRTLLRLVGF